jgi:O-antigen/teichoic acid export membrane protein
MSLAHSVVATAASRAYLTLLGLLVLPLYLQRLGAEAYGLVALFFTLQVWFQLLDMGLTATLARESARHRAGARSGLALRQLLRALERLFFGAVLVAGAVLYLGAEAIAQHWLNLQVLAPADAQRAIEWMAIGVMARLFGELHRAVIAGFERLDWLAGNNALFGTLRFLGVLPFMDMAGATAAQFFIYQAVVGVLELAVLAAKAHRLVPRSSLRLPFWDFSPLRGVLAFSLAMSAASVVWVFASQFDKLVLSGVLTLADYGAYGLAVAAATAVLLATGSLADALTPRITALQAGGDAGAVQRLYRQASQWTAVVACTGAATMACHAEALLGAWTGDRSLAAAMAPVLALYVLGNAAMAVAALPYYLQFAQGRLGLHLVGTGCMVLLLVPGVTWAATRHGALGAAAAWFAVNLLYLLAWTPVVHGRFAPGLHGRWLLVDIVPVALAAAAAGGLTLMLPWPDGRAAVALQLALVACAILLAAVAAASQVRQDLLGWLRPRN